MVTNLRDAKGRLSELVQLAAQGEEIVITVRGEARAILVGIKHSENQHISRDQWIRELSAAASAAKSASIAATSQEFWDELRRDQD